MVLTFAQTLFFFPALKIVGREDFESAILRSVAGIERKRSLLGSTEKGVVARHEVGHAVVQTAVASLLPGSQPRVEQLSIMARTGGALGFTYTPPQGEERSLLFSDGAHRPFPISLPSSLPSLVLHEDRGNVREDACLC